MSEKIAAVFDLDQTLTSVRSLESSFIMFLLRKRQIGIMNLLHSADFFLRNIWRDPVKAKKRNKMYLKDVPQAEIEQLSQSFFSLQGHGLIPGKSISLVNCHKRLGHLTILITGSPEILVRPLLAQCGLHFDHLYATRLKVTGDRYSGDIEGNHYYGIEKERLVRKLESELGFSLRNSFCYADSESDIPMMSLFGNPIAVNPDKALRKKSLRSDWQILATT